MHMSEVLPNLIEWILRNEQCKFFASVYAITNYSQRKGTFSKSVLYCSNFHANMIIDVFTM